MTNASRLSVEHLIEPRGILAVRPRLSWALPPGLPAQTGSRLQVRGGGIDWDSDMVDSGLHVLVPYAGPPVPAATRVEWRVMARTDAGDLSWSEWSAWETGIGSGDWTARWISPVGEAPTARSTRAPIVFRTTFDLDELPGRARAYATACGVYELFLNGARLGDAELTPGFTSYRRRMQVQVVDALPALQRGENVIVAIVSDGWWRGKVGFTQRVDSFGRHLALLAEIRADGRPVAVTDETWAWGTGRMHNR